MRPARLALLLSVLCLLLGGLLVAGPPEVAAQGEACFAETSYCVRGRFLAYWLAHGGLPRNGYPLSEERRERLEDGHEYTVQYFERVRLELHPENPPPYDVLLGHFGRRVLRDAFSVDAARYQAAIAPVAPVVDRAYFPQTGHNVSPRFVEYWHANGGLAQFGYPLVEEFEEYLPEGQARYRVQYFERARFEYHPENPPPYDVLLGQFGRAILAEGARLAGRFGALYITSERVRGLLGPPGLTPLYQAPGAMQEFERGRMFYHRRESGRGLIAILCGDPQAGQAFRTSRLSYFFEDTWSEGQDPGGGPGPRPGLYEPRLGFGTVWRERPAVRACLGYATTPEETPYTITVQAFARGVLLSTPDGQAAYVLYHTGTEPPGGYERFALPAR